MNVGLGNMAGDIQDERLVSQSHAALVRGAPAFSPSVDGHHETPKIVVLYPVSNYHRLSPESAFPNKNSRSAAHSHNFRVEGSPPTPGITTTLV